MSKLCNYLFLSLMVGIILGLPSRVMAEASLNETIERATNCGVPDESIALVKSRFDKGGEPEFQAVSLLTPLLEACVEQLPVTPLADRLAEGVAKHVRSRSIGMALERRLDAYRFARSLLLTRTGTLDPQALDVVGRAVDERVARQDFEQFVSEFGKAPKEEFLTGVTMISLQGQAGFDIELTREILRRGLEQGNLDKGWRYFVRVILTARKKGIDDRAVADAALAVLDNDGAVYDVLEELGFTRRALGGPEEN